MFDQEAQASIRLQADKDFNDQFIRFSDGFKKFTYPGEVEEPDQELQLLAIADDFPDPLVQGVAAFIADKVLHRGSRYRDILSS